MKNVEITFKGIPLVVQGYYEAGEEQIMYEADGGGYPGSKSDFTIEFIFIEDSEIDIFDIFGEKDLETITDLTIEKIEE